jgi:hypothetical protein
MTTIAAGAVNLPPFSVTLPDGEDFEYGIRRVDGNDWPDGTRAEIIFQPVGAEEIVLEAAVIGSILYWFKATDDVQELIAARPKKARMDYISPSGVRLLWAKGLVYVA